MKRILLIVIMLCIILGLAAERKALIVCNNTYPNMNISNAVVDADSMYYTLANLGFQVTKRSNLGLAGITAVVDSFSASVTATDDVVVYYTGHGANHNGTNYIVPARLDLAQVQDLSRVAYSIGNLAQKVKQARVSIIILEASRTWGTATNKAVVKPFMSMQAASARQMIISAAQPGKGIALLQVSQSTFTQALIERIRTMDLNLNAMMQLVISDVETRTGKLQKPWISGTVESDFRFRTPEMMLQWKRQPLKSIQGGGSLSW